MEGRERLAEEDGVCGTGGLSYSIIGGASVDARHNNGTAFDTWTSALLWDLASPARWTRRLTDARMHQWRCDR
jgi:hypothetical protein